MAWLSNVRCFARCRGRTDAASPLFRNGALAALLCLLPRLAHADGWLNIRFDVTPGRRQRRCDQCGSGLARHRGRTRRHSRRAKIVSGFALGVRREAFSGFSVFGQTTGVQRAGTKAPISRCASIAASPCRITGRGPSARRSRSFYGILERRSIGRRRRSRADGGFDYTHIYPMRNADVPKISPIRRMCVRTARRSCIPKRRCRSASGKAADARWIASARVIRLASSTPRRQGFPGRRAPDGDTVGGHANGIQAVLNPIAPACSGRRHEPFGQLDVGAPRIL